MPKSTKQPPTLPMQPFNKFAAITSALHFQVILFLAIFTHYFSSYYPSNITEEIAAYTSILYFILCSFGIWKIYKFIATTNAHSTTKRWLNRLLILPVIVIILTGIHFIAVSRGLPSLLSKLFINEGEVVVEIIDKRREERRKRTYSYATIAGLGIEQEFTVSDSFFDRAEVGKRVLINVRLSKFGMDFDI